MYGDNYGYRSGLNAYMVNHLTNKIKTLENIVKLSENDLVLDIGSNDATSLKAYTVKCKKVGIDPTGIKFKSFIPIILILFRIFFQRKFFQKIFKKQKLLPLLPCFTILKSQQNS